ncbi:MAG: hypothetical protein OEZ48_09505 [Candidatus Bathyarchaeota archaeon]|nr:hypothetical protein [Candidatus Bathyarchaeota archaeon]MDH5688080.1 hypothetical protein [Candidatus Bathyarchaeota archaeon]
MSAEDKPFKDREEVKKDIRLCAMMGMIVTFCSLGFAVLGVIGDALNITLGLESMSWFLLAIVFGLIAITPNMRSVAAKHLYGIENER